MPWENIKDFLLVVAPVCIAYMSYRSNKKSRKEIMIELEAKLKEKDVDTANEIQKMGVELENQKQLISWNNSQPQTDEYLTKIDIVRRGNVMNLASLIKQVNTILSDQKSKTDNLSNLREMLNNITLPSRDEELFPYEVLILYEYNLTINKLDEKIKGGEQNANEER